LKYKIAVGLRIHDSKFWMNRMSPTASGPTTKSRNDGDRLPVAGRDFAHLAFTAPNVAAQAGHFGRGAGFVDGQDQGRVDRAAIRACLDHSTHRSFEYPIAASSPWRRP
jgi:hypothetical protein